MYIDLRELEGVAKSGGVADSLFSSNFPAFITCLAGFS